MCVCACVWWVIHIVYVSFIVSLSRMRVSFIMSVVECGGSFRVSESFKVCVWWCVFMLVLWCPSIRGGVAVGDQGVEVIVCLIVVVCVGV